jgi:hypothetical protein
MPAAMRPYVSAGVALVGASVIAVTPITAPQAEIRSAELGVRLAAASIANVPANLINAVLSLPMAEIQGIQRFADAMEASGSWWVYTPVNVLGWDPANFEMTKGLVDALLPFPALSGPLGTQLNWWLAANLPMHQGCSGLPPCPDPIGMFSSMFTVGPWQFYTPEGYTFPTIFNPVSQHEGEVGQELGETGDEVDWSEEQVILDPLEPFTSVINYLMADPSQVTFPTFQQVVTAVTNLAAALKTTFYPFVPMSYIWNPEYQVLAPLFRAFAPVLCPDCNPQDPSLPPVTSTPESLNMVTLDASALRASPGDVLKDEDLGNVAGTTSTEVRSPDQQDGFAVGGTASTLGFTGLADDVVTTAKEDVAAKAAAPGPDTAVEATPGGGDPPSTAPTVPLINVTRDSLKAEPGQFGGQHRKPGGGLAGVVKSVQDTINSSISNITRGLTGGGATTGGATTGEASTGGTTE